MPIRTDIVNYFDFFIPEPVFNNSERLSHYRLFVAVCIFVCFFGLFLSVFIYWSGLAVVSFLAALISVSYALFLLLLKKGVPLEVLFHIAALIGFTNFTYNVYMNGGFDSLILIWYLILPVYAAMLPSFKHAVPWIIGCIVAYLSFYLQRISGEPLADNLFIGSTELFSTVKLVTLFGFGSMLVTITFFYNRTQQILRENYQIEKQKSESLLLNILPAEVASDLKEKGKCDAQLFDNVSVLFTDFNEFTTISEKLQPQHLIDELNECFSAFDRICEHYNIEKIKTVGDAYLAVSGLPVANPNHAEDVVNAALEIQQFMMNRKIQNADRKGLYDVRIGINSGSVVAGIVGIKKFAYDIWGDTVNTAARMEQNGEAGKVNISEATYELVKDKFHCEYRGEE